jgi:hypothetical protein
VQNLVLPVLVSAPVCTVLAQVPYSAKLLEVDICALHSMLLVSARTAVSISLKALFSLQDSLGLRPVLSMLPVLGT